MDTKSLEMLEFPRIRGMIAGHAASPAGRELANAIVPLQDVAAITRLLSQTAEARRLLELDRAFSVGDVADVRPLGNLAAKDGLLEPESLLEVKSCLAALHELRRYLHGLAEDFPLLWEIAGRIEELPQIERDIITCIDPAGDVLDSASPALAAIRRQLRETRSQILEKLEQSGKMENTIIL